eukprot:CAMPEP_0184550488 /NCGR_PEP_ID=MMETSP0199_2-20130426/20273_1 /TAXON_ID=1112570 /ORGANISM="Thraustochytrium sp., Strain LLF1b" /LENGTH=61 /DNA_ID=CAMNT_0026945369 /DNA_START=88 /DNA_END=273 /DNA_ORIENTATION=-
MRNLWYAAQACALLRTCSMRIFAATSESDMGELPSGDGPSVIAALPTMLTLLSLKYFDPDM